MSGYGAPTFSENEFMNPVSWFESYARKTRHSMPNIVSSEDALLRAPAPIIFKGASTKPNSSVTAIVEPVFHFRDGERRAGGRARVV